MCGRYTLINLAAMLDLLPWVREMPREEPRYNIAPTQPMLAVTSEHPERVENLQWGLVPSWAKDPAIGNQLCNARAESLAEKNTFKNAFKRRRCLIPADGFYEWKVVPGQKAKQPMYIRLTGGAAFAFAGLWESWHSPDGSELRTATIITTTPNELIEPIHNRMPVILHRADMEKWLGGGDGLSALLKPYPPEAMEAYPISTRVNSVRNEGPDLIDRIDPAPTSLFG